MPAPRSESCPLLMVNPERETLLPLLIAKMRKAGVPPAVLRCTVRMLEPGPLTTIFVERLGRALDKSIVFPGEANTAGSKLIVLVSAFKFAALIASRREQCEARQNPLSKSSVVLTVSAAGGRSSFRIVSVAGLVPPVTPPVAPLRVRFTVSLA